MSDRNGRVLTPWSPGAPPLNAVPTRLGPLRKILGSIPTRRQVMAEQVEHALQELHNKGVEPTLDELARRLGTDAGDLDLWLAFGLDHGDGRRLVWKVLDGWVEVPRQ